ncbi:MAG: SUMF1/EgtB/PvdO family nonheme iron enzyme [Saprospiraceae bacterium]|nr:SUMF1/EgtB/PvdO family nonheme iron enzyme [Saprospiraceae bacterium]
MKYFFLLYALLAALSAQSQCSEFDNLLQKGDNHLKGAKPDYQEAINAYTAAILACIERASEAKQRLAKMVKDINKIKDESEKQKGITADALQDLQLIADQAVPIVLADIDRDIYRLEYDSTYEKCKTALGLNARRPEVEKRIWEIAYFYTEADTVAAAVAFLNLLKSTRLTANTPDLQQKLRNYIRQTVRTTYLDTLNAKYYPKTVLVGGGSFWRKPIDFFPVERSEDSTFISVNSFYIGRTEITFWQYNVFARAKKHHIEPPPWEFCGDNPATNVNWYDAALYCNWLSERHNKKLGYLNLVGGNSDDVEIDTLANGYRLPTEAEWEFAARGGGRTKGYEFGGDSLPDVVAWYGGNSKNRTQPVGQLKANELDLYDISGNVWEWCQDWHFGGSGRVIRGGSWYSNDAKYCRSAFRNYSNPDRRTDGYGFRLVFVP